MVLVLYFLSLPLTGFNAFVHLSTILSRRSKINLIRSVCTALLKKDKEQAENIHHDLIVEKVYLVLPEAPHFKPQLHFTPNFSTSHVWQQAACSSTTLQMCTYEYTP
jgi:hypothetical protein